MNRINIFRIIAFCAIITIMVSCQKTENTNNEEYLSSKSLTYIPYYNSWEDIDSTMNIIKSLSNNELRIYAAEKNYLPIEISCEDFYKGTDFESFKSQKELLSFIKSNPNYLTIISDSKGELYIETPYRNSQFKYIANVDRLFQIGDIIYKIFSNGLVYTNKENLYKLELITDISIPSTLDKDIFQAIYSEQSNDIIIPNRDSQYNCGTHIEQDSEVTNNNKTKIEITVGFLNFVGGNGEPITRSNSIVLVRPYKKTAGIWYWCTRHISYDLNIAIDLNHGAGWQRRIFRYSGTSVYDSKIEETMTDAILTLGYYSTDSHIGGYNCWADTPSAPDLTIYANTNILQ